MTAAIHSIAFLFLLFPSSALRLPAPESDAAFACDDLHPMCKRDMKLFPQLPMTMSSANYYKRRVTQCAAIKTKIHSCKFVHIPKNGGTAVEHFSNFPFSGHTSMRRSTKLWGRNTSDANRHLMVVLRHPIERLTSWYHFLKSGNAQAGFRIRQKHFCEARTGKAYGNECVPKYSLYDFIAKDHSIFEYEYLFGKSEASGSSEPIGSDANFMFEWLKPYDSSTMTDVKEFLMDHFALIGDVSQIKYFLQQIAFMRGDDTNTARKLIEDMAKQHTKPTSHKTVMELFDEGQYAPLASRHSKDIELYYWAVQQVSALVDCFGLPDEFQFLGEKFNQSIPLDWWDFENEHLE